MRIGIPRLLCWCCGSKREREEEKERSVYCCCGTVDSSEDGASICELGKETQWGGSCGLDPWSLVL